MSGKQERVFSEQEVSALDQFVDRERFDRQMEAIARGDLPTPVPRKSASTVKSGSAKDTDLPTQVGSEEEAEGPPIGISRVESELKPPVKGQLPAETPASTSLRDAILKAEQLALPDQGRSLLEELAGQKTDDEDESEDESDDDDDENDQVVTLEVVTEEAEALPVPSDSSKPFDWAEDESPREMTGAADEEKKPAKGIHGSWRDAMVKDKGSKAEEDFPKEMTGAAGGEENPAKGIHGSWRDTMVKDKGAKKKISYESSSAGDPPAPIGIFKPSPSTELSRPTDGNFFVNQIATHQAEIVLQRQMIDALQKELKAVQKELSQTKIEVQSVRVLCVQMSDRITEFDQASLKIIDRAASLVSSGAPVTSTERISMEVESAKAKKSIESRESQLASQPLVSAKQRKKKTFDFE